MSRWRRFGFWRRFGYWRSTRPFWAGVFLMVSGLVILTPSYATLRLGDLVVSISTPGGAAALIIGVMLIVIGISVWLRPQFRLPAGIAAVLLALVSLPTANLGGLIVGMVLGLIGAALAISWSEYPRVGVLLLVTLTVGTTLGAPAPTAMGTPGASLVDQAPGRIERGPVDGGSGAEGPDEANEATPGQDCLPPEPDRARAPEAETPLLAVRPVRLEAAKVQLRRVDLGRSNKIVSVRTQQGGKRVLAFVVDAIDVTDLRQTVMADGAALILTTPAGSGSRLTGPLTLYLEKLCGTLATGPLGVGFGGPGALSPPISASAPPPFVLPEVTFTDVTIYAAGLLGAQLEVPGLALVADDG